MQVPEDDPTGSPSGRARPAARRTTAKKTAAVARKPAGAKASAGQSEPVTGKAVRGQPVGGRGAGRKAVPGKAAARKAAASRSETTGAKPAPRKATSGEKAPGKAADESAASRGGGAGASKGSSGASAPGGRAKRASAAGRSSQTGSQAGPAPRAGARTATKATKATKATRAGSRRTGSPGARNPGVPTADPAGTRAGRAKTPDAGRPGWDNGSGPSRADPASSSSVPYVSPEGPAPRNVPRGRTAAPAASSPWTGQPPGRWTVRPGSRVPRREKGGEARETDRLSPALRRSIRRLKRAIAVLLVLGVCGFLIDGADRPRDPRLVPATGWAAGKGSPGFGAATLSVNPSKGPASCVLEAVTPAQLQWGLMNRTSVKPYAGMAFYFATPSTDRFWMKDTLIPLSIAWFDTAGRFEAATLMPPCPKLVKDCPTYGPGRPYTLALEVPAGRLGAMGIGPGSTVQLGGSCS